MCEADFLSLLLHSTLRKMDTEECTKLYNQDNNFILTLFLQAVTMATGPILCSIWGGCDLWMEVWWKTCIYANLTLTPWKHTFAISANDVKHYWRQCFKHCWRLKTINAQKCSSIAPWQSKEKKKAALFGFSRLRKLTLMHQEATR